MSGGARTGMKAQCLAAELQRSDRMSSPPEEQDAAGTPQPDAKKTAPAASQSADAIAEAALRAAQEAIASANAGMQPTKQPAQPQQEATAASPTAAAQPAAEAQASSGKSTPGAVQMPDFAPQASAPTTDLPTERVPDGIALLDEVNLNVKIELGRTRMLIEDVLRLGEGSVVELDKLAGDPVDVYVNDRHVARGEVLVLSDNFCVRISEIISPSGEDNKARRTG